jgi:hypothetical protein
MAGFAVKGRHMMLIQANLGYQFALHRSPRSSGIEALGGC